MTLKYAHLAPSHKVKAVEALDGVLNEKPPVAATQTMLNSRTDYQQQANA